MEYHEKEKKLSILKSESKLSDSKNEHKGINSKLSKDKYSTFIEFMQRLLRQFLHESIVKQIGVLSSCKYCRLCQYNLMVGVRKLTCGRARRSVVYEAVAVALSKGELEAIIPI